MASKKTDRKDKDNPPAVVSVRKRKLGDEGLNSKQQHDKNRLNQFLQQLSPYVKAWIYYSAIYGMKIDAYVSVRDEEVECKSETSVSDKFCFDEFSWEKEKGDRHLKEVSDVDLACRNDMVQRKLEEIFFESRAWLFNKNSIQVEHNRLKLTFRSGYLVWITYEAARRIYYD